MTTRAACDCAHKFISLSRFYRGKRCRTCIPWTRSPRPSLPPPAQENDNLTLMVYYDDIAASSSRLSTCDFTEAQTGNRHVEYAPGAPASGSTYSGIAAITAQSDLLKRGSSYALVGYQVSRTSPRSRFAARIPATSASRCQARHLSRRQRHFLLRLGELLQPAADSGFPSQQLSGIFIEQVSNDLARAITASLILCGDRMKSLIAGIRTLRD